MGKIVAGFQKLKEMKELEKLFKPQKKTSKIVKWFINWFSKIWSYVGWDDYIAFIFLLIGLLCYFDSLLVYFPRLNDFFVDIRSEFVGMSLSVLIIANAVEVIGRREEKKRLILQMGSPNNIFAIEALRQLDFHGWTRDETLVGAKLQRADLYKADLILVNMMNANLNGAILEHASMQEINLRNATLNKASLVEADLRSANLTSAILREANCSDALFCGAKLMYADLEQANLNNADLRSADLTWADLTDTKLTNAKYNDATNWPRNFKPKEVGAILNQDPLPGSSLYAKVKLPQEAKAAIFDGAKLRYKYITKQRVPKKTIVVIIIALLVCALIFGILGYVVTFP